MIVLSNKDIMKPIPNHQDYYITESGNVWSNKTNKFLKTQKLNHGHLVVALGNHNKKYLIHRLVLETFVGPCPDGLECRHLNGIPNDNRLENLVWGTHRENMKDNVIHNKWSNPFTKLSDKDIRMIIYMWNTGLFSQKEIGDIYETIQSNISQIVNGKTRRHIWNS